MAQPGFDALFAHKTIIPVLLIEDAASAVPLARALMAGGLAILEVTLRTDAALESIRRIAAEVEGCIVGSGTVLTPAQAEASAKAGARFGVSPGGTEALLARGDTLPLLPGAATASESMRLIELGYRFQKFFPAEPAGGAPYLASLASPLPQARFCPTGGVNLDNAGRYLSLANVFAIGGSWMAPRAAVADGDWARITELARAAAVLR
jgi:2-dehydro-3-deoxyphosphogluconate aldolase / (4S)-4-hydroxy-2-oxoglutarate aldolase